MIAVDSCCCLLHFVLLFVKTKKFQELINHERLTWMILIRRVGMKCRRCVIAEVLSLALVVVVVVVWVRVHFIVKTFLAIEGSKNKHDDMNRTTFFEFFDQH